MVARYRPLIANVNNSKKRFSETCDTRGNTLSLKGKVFSRQVSQRGADHPSQNVLVTKKSGSSSVHTKSGPFEWTQYLKEIDAEPVQSSLFLHVQFEVQVPSPSDLPGQNVTPEGHFKPGQYLEGVDPHNESLICVLCVSELVGRRVKLHFAGYPEKYDFWTTIDSPFLFPVGWCAHNSRQLQPPKEYLEESYHPFSWTGFLAKVGAKPVPRQSFKVPWDSPVDTSPPHMFSVGLKLEAIDKRNPALACVATIKDCIGDYILIHFDGWDSGFDQWAHISSELLHPVGYCEDHEQVLSIPSDWNNRRNGFSWKLYLKETNSKPVPKEAFDEVTKFAKSSRQFQINQRLEAVDKRCPSLIRVASIVDNTPPGFLTLGYDGWSDKYNIRVEVGSLDLFPVGYCHASGHPLQVPPGYDSELDLNGNLMDSYSNSSASSLSCGGTANPVGGCPTPGCKGYGHIKGPRYFSHQRISGCPYADGNLKKDAIRAHERLSSTNILTSSSPFSVDSENPDSSATTVLVSAYNPLNRNSGQRLSPDSTVKNEFSSHSTSTVVTSCSLLTCPYLDTNVPTPMPGNSLTLQFSIADSIATTLPGYSSVISNLHQTISPTASVQSSLPNESLQSNVLPLNLTLEKLPDFVPKEIPLRTELPNSYSPAIGISVNTVPQCENSNHSSEVTASVIVLSNESSISVSSSITKSNMSSNDSHRPQKLSKLEPNILDNVSPPNLLSQTSDQSDEYAKNLGVSPMPIKRKRGRPRKYTSIHVLHPSIQQSRPVHFASLTSLPQSYTTSTGRHSYPAGVSSQHHTLSSATVPVSSVSITSTLSLCSNMNMTINPHPSIDCQSDSFLPHNLESNNLKNIDILKSVTCSSEPSPADSVLTNACINTNLGYIDVDRFRSSSGYEIAGQHTSTLAAVNDLTPGYPINARLTQEITPIDLCSNRAPRLTVMNSSCMISNTSNNIFPPQPLIEAPNSGWYPDGTNGSFMSPMCHNSVLSQFYIDPAKPSCLLPSFDLSSSSNYTNVPVSGLSIPSIRDVDLMGRLLPQAGAAIRAAKVAGLPGPHSWNPNVVANFISTLPGCKQFACKFTENEIDGAALLCLEQHDLMHILGMKLGPAVKVSTAIQALRKSLLATPISELGPEHANAIAAAVSCFTNSLSSQVGVSSSVATDSQSIVNGSNVDTSSTE
ncbi:Lethal(3)malignant brain tumor-like protein 3 [Schistosoma japonicum]|nr:Lethal(3)malignant brain tumor-like protein 3 [Schistosoma japonicum]